MEANSWVGPQTTLEKNLVDFCEPFFGASAAFLANLKKGYNEAGSTLKARGGIR
jgi:hypothetical protein